MGRNGTRPPVFPEVVKFLREKYASNEEFELQELLLGKEYGRNVETAYVYQFLKLNYVQLVEGSLRKRKARLKAIHDFPPRYTSQDLKRELAILNYDKHLTKKKLNEGEVPFI